MLGKRRQRAMGYVAGPAPTSRSVFTLLQSRAAANASGSPRDLTRESMALIKISVSHRSPWYMSGLRTGFPERIASGSFSQQPHSDASNRIMPPRYSLEL